MSIDVSEEVKFIISKKLEVPIEQLTPETKIADLGAESLDIIEIVFMLEERFGIDIPLRADEASRSGSGSDSDDSENLGLMTIADILQAVKERVDAKV